MLIAFLVCWTDASISFGADAVNSGEVGEYITDEAKARAVKQVVIRSKKLKEMKMLSSSMYQDLIHLLNYIKFRL